MYITRTIFITGGQAVTVNASSEKRRKEARSGVPMPDGGENLTDERGTARAEGVEDERNEGRAKVRKRDVERRRAGRVYIPAKELWHKVEGNYAAARGIVCLYNVRAMPRREFKRVGDGSKWPAPGINRGTA